MKRETILALFQPADYSSSPSTCARISAIKGLPETLELACPHAVDAEHFAGGQRRLFGHLDKRRVVKDHIWRDVLFVGDRFT